MEGSCPRSPGCPGSPGSRGPRPRPAPPSLCRQGSALHGPAQPPGPRHPGPRRRQCPRGWRAQSASRRSPGTWLLRAGCPSWGCAGGRSPRPAPRAAARGGCAGCPRSGCRPPDGSPGMSRLRGWWWGGGIGNNPLGQGQGLQERSARTTDAELHHTSYSQFKRLRSLSSRVVAPLVPMVPAGPACDHREGGARPTSSISWCDVIGA